MGTRITPRPGLYPKTKSMLNSMSPRPPSHQSVLVAENNSSMYKIGTEALNHTSRVRFTWIVHQRVVPGGAVFHGTLK